MRGVSKNVSGAKSACSQFASSQQDCRDSKSFDSESCCDLLKGDRGDEALSASCAAMSRDSPWDSLVLLPGLLDWRDLQQSELIKSIAAAGPPLEAVDTRVSVFLILESAALSCACSILCVDRAAR